MRDRQGPRHKPSPAFCIVIIFKSIQTLGSLQLLAKQTSGASSQYQATLRQTTSIQTEHNMADQTLVRPDTVDNKDGQEGSEVR
jgi:hypothetical protein